MNSKKQNLFIILSGIFITNAILAEVIGVKIFSLEKLFGMAPAQISLFGNHYDFNLSAGVVIWPVIFVFTDIINEYYGKKGVRRISYLAAAFIAYVFLALFLVNQTPPADFWLAINSTVDGQPFNINLAYDKIFSQSMGIIIGSLIAFLISQFLDVYVFHYLRSKTGPKWIWLRATGSTLISQLVDSFVVLYIAFKLFGGESAWSWDMLFAVGIMNYLYKFLIAVVMTPVLYIVHFVIDGYLGKETAAQMAEDAAKG